MAELLFKLSQIGLLISTLWIVASVGLFLMYRNSSQEEIDKIRGVTRSFSIVIPIIIFVLSLGVLTFQ